VTKVQAFQNEWFTEQEIAEVLGISLYTLRNRISRGENHPPFSGYGKHKRFYKDEFLKWDRKNMTREVRSA